MTFRPASSSRRTTREAGFASLVTSPTTAQVEKGRPKTGPCRRKDSFKASKRHKRSFKRIVERPITLS
eukprot:Skav203390  [mRNA]  locus=scaffold3093:20971:23721:+ [translate_table: standard]